MRSLFVLFPLAAVLSGCGGYEDASSEAEPDTVEVHANEALEGVDAMPVADPDANTDIPDDDASADDQDAAQADDAEASPEAAANDETEEPAAE